MPEGSRRCHDDEHQGDDWKEWGSANIVKDTLAVRFLHLGVLSEHRFGATVDVILNESLIDLAPIHAGLRRITLYHQDPACFHVAGS